MITEWSQKRWVKYLEKTVYLNGFQAGNFKIVTVKYCKVPKYYDQDYLKTFFSSLHFQWSLKFLEKVFI